MFNNEHFSSSNFKKPGGLTYALVIVAALGLSACSKQENDHISLETSAEDVREEFSEFADSAKDFAFDKKEDASEFLDQEIEKLDNKIDQAEQNLDEHKAEISESFAEEKQEAIESIKGYREDLQNMADTVKHSSQEEWQEIRSDVALAYNNTKKSIQNAWNAISNNS